MPIINRFAELHRKITGWRRDFHQYPELLYDVERTAGRVGELLASFGVDEVVTGIGRTGVVGLIRGRRDSASRTIGLRADMDALPIMEATGKPYASKNPGKMHACGHDGHTAMLLGAAKYLAETRNFDGRAIVIFQPAEEGGAGGKAMVDDGLMERFGIEQVFGMHNIPGLDTGRFAIRKGGIMAATDEFTITVRGVGGHAAAPHGGIDPVLTAAQMTVALQAIVSRNVDPVENAVLTVTRINGGNAINVIPDSAMIMGTIRTLEQGVRELMERRLHEMAEGIAAASGASVKIAFRRGYPVTVNAPGQTEFAAQVARQVAGEKNVDDDCAPMMAGEDFSYMAIERPGAFIFIGNGNSAELHQAEYDFNDEIIPLGCTYWVRLVETAMPLQGGIS